ncbi:hypothetical protein [Sphingobacterium sp.]|uniref:hypothetical protein n=1 Tax=Sphingobacterium sp. TaxID=341027 RepID=UPI0025ED2AC5|nr:hypothetical protein [Sphingobacterium sp.]
MNTKKDIYNRLLRLFPAKHTAKTFDTKAKRQDKVIEEILGSNTDQEILDYALNNFEITKQNVYVYSTRKYTAHKLIDANDLGLEISYQNYASGKLELYGYQMVVFEAKTYNDIEGKKDIQVKLKQPFKVVIEGGYLIISLTKIEVNLKTYFDEHTSVFDPKKITDDSGAINAILTYFDNKNKIRPQQSDLNKGVKHIWDKDVIDCREMSCRRTSSRRKETMDGDELFKNKYPEDYKEIMMSPLESCIFRYIRKDEDLPEHFTCDASKGRLSFTLYPERIDQINNVLDEIIRNN